MTSAQEFIYTRTYSRWLPEQNRREKWPETVKRYLDFMAEEVDGITVKHVQTAQSAIENMDVMPSMRALWAAGPAARNNNITLYNCFAGDEEFVTSTGPIAFKDAVGGTVFVRAGDGEWRLASVQHFGKQPVSLVTLKHWNGGKAGSYVHTVKVTPNHRWILQDGSETTDLKVGDKLLPSTVEDHLDSFDYQDGWRHGFVYGDGTISYVNQVGYAMVRLCGKKVKYLDNFQGCDVSYPPSNNGDPVVYLGKENTFMKDLPECVSSDYVAGFVQGLIDSDGSITDGGNARVDTQKVELVTWLKANASRCGYKVLSHRIYNNATNFGERSSPLNQLLLGRGQSAIFRVESIEPAGEEDVYCVVEPVTSRFTLANGQVTGNCSYLAVNDIRAFSECLFILMCGTGVGFSVERKYVDQLPTIMPRTGETRQVVVEDSKEGWAASLLQVMMYLWAGYDVTVDYSKVRPRGSRLLTMGGRASGPEPLMNLFNFLIRKFEEKRSKKVLKLDSLDCLDIMNMIADIVVVGGVRRSSEISLSDLSDRAIAEAKMGEFWNQAPWRSMSNNSAVYEGKPDPATFLQEWTTLVKSGSGERGIFNRYGAAKQMVNSGRREPWDDIGTNPCGEIILRDQEFCVHGDTVLITRNGAAPIKDLVNVPVEVWNGEQWSLVTPRNTGTGQKMVRVQLSDGSYLDCTPDHRFSVKHRFMKEWQELTAAQVAEWLDTCNYPIQVQPTTVVMEGGAPYTLAYTLGFSLGDGHTDGVGVYADLYGAKKALPLSVEQRQPEYLPKGYNVPKQRVKLSLPLADFDNIRAEDGLDTLFSWDKDSILSFIAGWADADGSETGTGGIRLYGAEYRLRKAQLLLKKAGVECSVNKMSEQGEITNLGERKTDVWYLQITDCATIPCHRLDTSKGHKPKFKGKTQTVVSVTELPGTHDSYCFNEPLRHMGLFGNVLTYQCNLSEVVVRPNDTLDVLKKKVKLATMFGCWQASFTNFPFLRKDWQANCNEERLLGVSLTGIMDHPVLNHVNDRMKKWLAEMKSVAVAECEKWCARLNMNMSAAITCVKPSGTVSQLVNCASGIHPRYAQYYIRRYRISATDPLFRLMRDAGVVAKPEVGQTSETAATMVLEFPFASPDNAKTRHDYSAIDQLEHWKVVKDFWCEHNPSITVYVDESEWVKTAAWVHDNFDDVCGVSFLPKDNGVYQLAPYEEINKNTWKSLVTQFPEVNYGLLSEYEQEDNTQGSQSYACLGDKCEL